MKTVFSMFMAVLLLQACATQTQDAPAPCASTERDCGPAQPLNGSFTAHAGMPGAEA